MSTSVPPPNMPDPSDGGQWPAPVGPGDAPTPAGGFGRRLPDGRRRVVAFALAVVVIAALVFVLLGSTSSRLDPVAQAATRSATAPGYRLRMSMVMSLGQVPGGIQMTGSGVVSERAHAAQMSMTMALPSLPQITQALGGTTLQLNEILRGTTVYIELPQALASKLPYSKKWISIDVLKAAGVQGLSSLPGGVGPATGDPSQFLQYLRAASDSVVATGHALVDGHDTTHYRAQLDFSKVGAALPASERPMVEKALAALEQRVNLGTIPVDVWIDKHHLVRRIGMTMNMTLSGASVAAQMTEDFSHYGPQTPPSPPPADQVQSIR